jgi:hypothetical protein
MRKRSKDITTGMAMKNRESFADLIVILGLKYNEFVGKEYIF